jgi:hypothetical protein
MTLRLIDAHAPQLLVDGRETDDKTELTTIALDMMAKVGKGDIRMFIEEMARVYGTIINTTHCECGAPIMTYEIKI